MVCPENGTAVLKGFVTSFVFSRTTSNIFTVTPPSGLYFFEAVVNPFSTGVPFWGQASQIPSSLSPKRDCGSKRFKIATLTRYLLTLFSSPAPFWGQTTQVLAGLSPKRDCSPKGVNSRVRDRGDDAWPPCAHKPKENRLHDVFALSQRIK